MTERDSPKAQLRVTLEAARDVLKGPLPPDVRIPMASGLIDHALALSLRVGESSRGRPIKSEPEQESA